MKATIRNRLTQITATLVALALVLSVFGPIGTAAALDGLTVDQTADGTTVTPGETIQFTTTIDVDSSVVETSAVALQVELPDGWTIVSQTPGDTIRGPDGWLWFPGGDVIDGQTTVTYTVQVPSDELPDGTQSEMHTVTAVAITPDGGETTDQTTITVEQPTQPDPANFQVSSLDVPSPVTQGDTATVTATIQNTGDEQGVQTVSVSVDGTQVDSEEVTLAGGASQQVDFDVDTGSLSEGDHTVEVSTDDDSASGLMVVEGPPDPANFDVSGLNVPSSVNQGDMAAVSATIQNTGDVAGTQTISVSVDGTQVDSEEVTLASGASQQVDFDVDTSGLSVGDHSIEIASEDDSETAQLTVQEPPTVPETSVSLSPASDTVAPDDTTTYDVVVDSADGGVGAFTVTVSVGDTSVATITDAEFHDSAGNTNEDLAADGSSITIDAATMDTDDTGSVTIATVTVEGQATGSTDLSVSVGALGDEGGTDYTVTGTNGASLTVKDLTVGDFPAATDPDGDGKFEDVNGNGEANVVDVQALFANLDELEQSNLEEFDFNNDGKVDVVDVQKLFVELTGGS